jgi:hypothetical protein
MGVVYRSGWVENIPTWKDLLVFQVEDASVGADADGQGSVSEACRFFPEFALRRFFSSGDWSRIYGKSI